MPMNPIEKAARALCAVHGDNPDARAGGAARWVYYVPHVAAVTKALHEPSPAMKDAGSEIIRHVGDEESKEGHRSDAANVWRFMIDALRQETYIKE